MNPKIILGEVVSEDAIFSDKNSLLSEKLKKPFKDAFRKAF